VATKIEKVVLYANLVDAQYLREDIRQSPFQLGAWCNVLARFIRPIQWDWKPAPVELPASCQRQLV
jgi:hypothetical protein